MRKRKEKQHQLLGAEKGKIASAKVKRLDKLALDYLELVNFVFPTNSSQHRPVFLDAKSKLFITFRDISFYGTASFGYSSNFRFKIGH